MVSTEKAEMQKMLALYKLSDSDIRSRLNFIGFTDPDAQLLSSIRLWAETIVREVSKEFYDRSFSDPGFAEVVQRNNSNRTILEQAQANYCLNWFGGFPNTSYVEYRQLVGARHAAMGITPQYYIASYQFYYDILFPLVRKYFGRKRGQADQAVAAINKLMVFDQSVIMDMYVNGVADRLRDMIGGAIDGVSASSTQLSSATQQAGTATESIATSSNEVAQGTQQQADAVSDVNNAMKQLSTAIEQIASGSQEQAKGVEQTSQIVQQVSTAINDVARNAQEAAEGSSQADEAARKGGEMVEQTIEGMKRISSAVTAAAERITELGTQSEEIGKIVAVIDDIAAQTNLLALNAAIEAARAGEQGRGFAVVAEEVRGLAERVTEATKEIANLIDNIQKGVGEAVTAVEEGTNQVEEGVKLAEASGASLGEIQTSVQGVSSQVEAISASAQQVSASSDEMIKSVEGVSAVTEQNTAAAQEMAANSTQVSNAIATVSRISEDNSAAVQQISASSEEMTAQVQQVVESAQALSDMAGDLQTRAQEELEKARA